MKLLERKKEPKVTLTLNIMAIFMVIFAIFNIYTSNKYIADLVKQGFKPSNQVSEVINYYLTAVTPYVFYAICLFALGYIIKKVVYLVDDESLNRLVKENLGRPSVANNEDDDIDMLLKDLDD